MRHLIIAFFFSALSFQATLASRPGSASPGDSTQIDIEDFVSQHTEGQWFLAYRYGDMDGETLNQFTLKRGYITFKNDFTDNLSVRFTQDITLDEEGSDMGNVEMRLKYCYLNYELDDFMFFTKPTFEAGLVHRPWLDFEQKINPYRVQGKMFLERAGLMNSADFGLMFSSLLGGEMDESYQKRVNSKYPGRYGSFSVGVYNGGGYHALERNTSKNIEGRLTLRPFPGSFPGLQFTYNMAYGRGNTPVSPDFILNSGFASYENSYMTLTFQYYKAKGNSSGSYADNLGRAYENSGYSAFGEYEITGTPLKLFGRYDRFQAPEMGPSDHQRIIAGVAYNFYKNNKLIIDLDAFDRQSNGTWDQRIWEAAIEIRF
jgi:hypothetical protein